MRLGNVQLAVRDMNTVFTGFPIQITGPTAHAPVSSSAFN